MLKINQINLSNRVINKFLKTFSDSGWSAMLSIQLALMKMTVRD